MRLGLYFDLRDPRGRETGWSRHYRFVLEACEEADRLGADSVWFTEHHGFDDGYLPQPLTFAAAVAARTKRVRIGTAVVIAPLRHPVHLAEEAALVDVLSEGRLDLGLGAGYRHAEFALFGADLRTRMRATVETAVEMERLWAGGLVTPMPRQASIPLWFGFGGQRGAALAGEHGGGLLSLDPSLLPAYLTGIERSGATPRMSGLLPAYASPDPERDWATVGRLHANQWDSYHRHSVEGTDADIPAPVDPERARRHGLRPDRPGICFGDADQVSRAIIDHVAGLPVDTVLVWAGLPGQQEAAVIDHLRYTLAELAPRLAAASSTRH